MNKYPIRHLPNTIREVLHRELISNGYVTELPHAISIRGDKTFMYFCPMKPVSTAFVINVNLQNKQCDMQIGGYEASYASAAPDRDKSKRNLEKGNCIVKGYLTQNTRGMNSLTDMEIIFHPSQCPRPIPEVKLSDRERQILFCFGMLKDGNTRREAILRLEITKPEIEAMIEKRLLKKAGNGHIMTVIAEANRLPKPEKGEKIIVDRW